MCCFRVLGKGGTCVCKLLPCVEQSCYNISMTEEQCFLQFPERIYRTQSAVMCLDFSKAHPNLLAVSFASAS